jgi:hypothetical protein
MATSLKMLKDIPAPRNGVSENGLQESSYDDNRRLGCHSLFSVWPLCML